MVGRLWADERRHGLDGGLIRLRLLEHGQDGRLDEFRGLYQVDRCSGKGMLDAVNQCTHVFAFSPVYRRGVRVDQIKIAMCR